MTRFSSIPRPTPGASIAGRRVADIIAAGAELQERYERLTLPPGPARGPVGPRGHASPVAGEMPELSLLAPALFTADELASFSDALLQLGDITLPEPADWCAVWCATPRIEGGAPSVLPVRNTGWRCTPLSVGTTYTLLCTGTIDRTAPREVWMRESADGFFLPLYNLHGGGAADVSSGIELTLTEGEPSSYPAAAGWENCPLGSIRWSAEDTPYFEPLTKLLGHA